MNEDEAKFREEVSYLTVRQKVDRLCDALENLWGGGGDYGIYTKAREREYLRSMMHELLGEQKEPKGE